VIVRVAAHTGTPGAPATSGPTWGNPPTWTRRRWDGRWFRRGAELRWFLLGYIGVRITGAAGNWRPGRLLHARNGVGPGAAAVGRRWAARSGWWRASPGGLERAQATADTSVEPIHLRWTRRRQTPRHPVMSGTAGAPVASAARERHVTVPQNVDRVRNPAGLGGLAARLLRWSVTRASASAARPLAVSRPSVSGRRSTARGAGKAV